MPPLEFTTPSQIVRLKGSTLYRKDPDTEVFVRVAQLRIVPVPSVTQVYEDGTNHDSPGDFEEVVPTIKRGDESAAALVFSPSIAMHKQIWDDFTDQTKLTWRSLFPDQVHGWEFEAFLLRYGFSGGGLEYSALAVLDYSLRMTGMPEWIEQAS